MDKREQLKVSQIPGTKAVPLPQLDGLQEECAGGRGSVLRRQDAEQRELYREGCILGSEKGTMREPREPRLGMDSPTPCNLPLPHPLLRHSLLLLRDTQKLSLQWLNSQLRLLSSNPLQYLLLQEALPGSRVRRWAEHTGVELHGRNDLFP